MGMTDARGFQVRRQDLVDLALALAVAAASMVGTLTGSYGDRYGQVLLLDLAVTLPLAVRRRAPLLTFLTVLAMIVARALLLGDLDGGGVFFSLIVGGYSLGAHAPLRRALVGILAFVPAMMWAGWLTAADWLDDVVFLGTLVGGFWLAGRVVWSRNRLLERLVEQAEELRLSREAEARARAAEHRARIGRDVHDVVAHSVSLMVVQAEAGEAQLGHDHPSAECLRAIQRVGRSTLGELRTVLGTIAEDREEDAPETTSSGGPRLRDAHRLAADLVEAGLHVDLDIESGGAVEMPDDVELAAYRILQEALTNALRHAPDAMVTASVRVAEGELLVDVVSSGGRAAAPTRYADGVGRGITGMQERAARQGGEVLAGPTEDGFTVRARIPLPHTVETPG
jgi:signal transduction histidine kinase